MDDKKVKQKTLEEIKALSALAPATLGSSNDIDPNATNDSNPLQSSLSWQITPDMYDTTDPNLTPPFSWIKAFFDPAAFVGIPGVVVQNVADSSIASFVPFAWRGEPVFFKGCKILSSGVDRFGRTITSTLIGEDPTTELTALWVEGGFR
jgi:hypothetical protein